MSSIRLLYIKREIHMILERIEILNFRGLKRLSLDLNEITVLIGENAWGKSSLLDAITVALSPEFLPYKFSIKDFHIDLFSGLEQATHLQIVLQWREQKRHKAHSAKYKPFSSYWCHSEDGFQRLFYCISADRTAKKVTSERVFLDKTGAIIHPVPADEIIENFIDIHPVIRLQDARRAHNQKQQVKHNNSRQIHAINNTVNRLQTQPGLVNKGELTHSLNTIGSLISHHFIFKQGFSSRSLISPRISTTEEVIDSINQLQHLITHSGTRQSGILLLSLLNNYIQSRGDYQLKPYARPLWIFEEPESRLHPTLLNQIWELLQKIPMQKVLTTNSSDLLSCTPLTAIRRLVRRANYTHVYYIQKHELSHDEFRRVGFHIRFHRPITFFARSWLLVEGETEIWLFTEFARLLGYNLAAEGIYLVEFAQSGLKPLIKMANALAIEWYVMTDGDNAGNKYIATARNFVENNATQQHITKLPALDIEHYLYEHGYEPVFRRLAGVSDSPNIKENKVIHKAINRHAKPDIALAMARFCETRGPSFIPPLFRYFSCANISNK